ncbi:hypothetical protein [Neorhizobium petrolearium]|uniref:hypothetical protein n=1 Tax=Neorhizobium petrolearium TaxID=515361 RepID=UPI003F7E09C8
MTGNDYSGQGRRRFRPKLTDPLGQAGAAARGQTPARKCASKTGWIYFFVSIFIVVPLAAATLLGIAWLNSGDRAALRSSSSFYEQKELSPTVSFSRYVEPVLGGPETRLREDFHERSGWPTEGRVLSIAGYPILVALKEAPACANPYHVKEALDAFRSGDRRWLTAMPGCELIDVGTTAEWMPNPYKGLETVAMRLALPDGSRKTLYGPSNNPDVGIEAWFGHRYRR